MKIYLVILTTLLSGCITQPEWTPEAFRPECRGEQLWASNELGEEIELEDSWDECPHRINEKGKKE